MAATYSRRRQQRGAVSVGSTLLDEVAQITGDRWASLILRSIFSGMRKFDEIYRDTAMATNILSERLSWLTTMGIVQPVEYSTTPQRFEYRLTEKGIDYYPILLMLLEWGDKYYMSPEGPPLKLQHKAKSRTHQLEPSVTCSCCGGVIKANEVTYTVVEAETASRSPARSAG
jgi:DNA-binding HxlR family transcriptional regulator